MKKVLTYIVVLMFALLPIMLKAEEKERTKIDLSKYETLNFKQALEEEGIELKNKSYSENDKQATIYLFRGRGCHVCQSFLSYLNDISEEYGSHFKVVSFELWYNQDNANLLDDISSFKGETAGGVPYILIGEQVFGGYAEQYNDAIIQAIEDVYNGKDKYDVFEAYNDSIKYHLSTTAKMVIWNIILLAIASFIIIHFVNKSNQKVLEKLDEIKNTNNVKITTKETSTIQKKVVKRTNAKK